MANCTLRRAMVICGDEALRIAILAILKRRHYEVHDAAEPSQCPVYLNSECSCPVDHACTSIILTDAILPKMTGLDFIKSQKNHGCKVTNIGVMATVWKDSEIKSFTELGCQIFTKPFKLKELTKWLDKCERKIEPNFKLADLPRPEHT